MRLAYGLGIVAALITGGTALYYAASPRSTITAPDVVELLEGVNERRAALEVNAHVGSPDGGWDFGVYTTQSAVFAHATMKSIMDQCMALAPSFVKAHSSTGYSTWTAAELFKVCGVGPADGTQTLFTVGFLTNGLTVYSNAPWATIPTNLLWECYRLLASMTTTVNSLTDWALGPMYSITPVVGQGTNEVAPLSYQEGPIYYTNPAPAWYTNITLIDSFNMSNTVSGLEVTIDGVTNGLTGTPYEQLIFNGYPSASRWISMDDVNWYYNVATSNKPWYLNRCESTGYVSVAQMAAGITSAVTTVLAQDLEVKVTTYDTNGVASVYTITNANLWYTNWLSTVAHTGVSANTPWQVWTEAGLPRMHALVDMGAYTSTGRWAALGNNNYPKLEFLMRPQVKAFIDWTFTRCRP